MTESPKTIGLCMIVKNEAHVMRRCLAAALPLIDYALVVDTGSVDGTPDLVRRLFEEHALPGQVLHDDWRDFASNRSFAIAQLRSVATVDYALMLDADDLLIIDHGLDPRSWKAGLRADIYHVAFRCGGLAYTRPQLWRNSLPVSYRGVLHEFLDAPPKATRAHATGIRIHAVQDSARNRNPKKYAEDARVLADAAAKESDAFLRSRYTFYEARCQESAGNVDAALAAYRRRAELGFWKEEVYVSLVGVARLLERKGSPPSEVIGACLAALDVMPGRGEALHLAMRFCRINRMHQAAWLLAKHAAALPRPAEGLFLDTSVYDWRLADEYALAAYHVGHFAESLRHCETLLADPRLPEPQRSRIKANADFARSKLAAGPSSRQGATDREQLADEEAPDQQSGMLAVVLGDGLVLARASSDRLFALDATRRFLWQSYNSGTPRAKLASDLAKQLGIDLGAAEREVADALLQWQVEGLIEPSGRVVRIAFGSHCVELSCESADMHAALATTFSQVAVPTGSSGGPRFNLRGNRPFTLLRDGRQLAEFGSIDAALRGLGGAIRDAFYDFLPWRLAVPGAAVSRGRDTILIPGLNEVGGSSLAATLLQDDEWELIADDLVLFSGERMRIEALTLPSVQQGEGMDLCWHWLPTPTTAPTPLAATAARHRSTSPAVRQPRELRAVVVPTRRPGVEPYLVPLTPGETLGALLKSSCRIRPPVTAQAMAHLVSWIERLPAWQLVHAEAADARTLVANLLR